MRKMIVTCPHCGAKINAEFPTPELNDTGRGFPVLVHCTDDPQDQQTCNTWFAASIFVAVNVATYALVRRP